MQPNRRLNEILPVRFRNGEQIRQFSKPCVQCGQMLNAQHMAGVVRLVGDHIAIAAQAKCPVCGAQFSVTCLIDEGKRVRRVILPYWLFNPYLRMINDDPQSSETNAADAPVDVPKMPEPAPQSVIPLDIVRATDVVGRYQGKPIPAWVLVNGKQFSFERVALEARTGADEFLLDDCLVYRLHPQ